MVRINMHAMKKMDMIINRKSLDSDHAVLNNYAVRKRVTIGQLQEEFEKLKTIDKDIILFNIEVEIEESMKKLNLHQEEKIKLLDKISKIIMSN